jgi:hypothetical protein
MEILASSRPKNIAQAADAKNTALIMFGGEYGNFSSHAMPPKRLG